MIAPIIAELGAERRTVLRQDESGVTLVEYAIATGILVLGLLMGIFVFEGALTGKINEGRCTYTDYNLPDPRSSSSSPC